MGIASLAVALFLSLLVTGVPALRKWHGRAAPWIAGLQVAPWIIWAMANLALAATDSVGVGVGGADAVASAAGRVHPVIWLAVACASAALIQGRPVVDSGLFGIACAAGTGALLAETSAIINAVCAIRNSGADPVLAHFTGLFCADPAFTRAAPALLGAAFAVVMISLRASASARNVLACGACLAYGVWFA
jgi:hypothetical protein